MLGISVVWGMFLIGKLIWNESVGLVAAFLTAVYPNIVMYTPLVISENPFIFFFVWSLYFFLKGWKQGSPKWIAAAGIALALAALTRSAVLVCAPLMVIALVFTIRWNRALVLGVVFLACVTVTIMPWTIRNYLVMGRFILISTNHAYVLFHGNNPAIHTSHVWRVEYENGPGSMNDMLRANVGPVPMREEIKLMEYTQSAAMAYIAAYPHRFLIRAVQKFADFWGLERYIAGYYRSGYYRHLPAFLLPLILVLMQITYVCVMILGGIGAVATPNERSKWFLVCFVVLYTGVHLISIGHERYRYPVLYVTLLFAAYALVYRREIWRRIRETPLATAWLAVTGYLLVMASIWLREIFFIDADLWLEQFRQLL